MEIKEVSYKRYHCDEWNMDADVKLFGLQEIKRINNTKGIKFQMELEDLHERCSGLKAEYQHHIVSVIFKDLSGKEIRREETFDSGLNPYLYGIQALLYVNSKVN